MSAATAPAMTPPPGSVDESFLLTRVQPALSAALGAAAGS
jgi:hypothetical protein